MGLDAFAFLFSPMGRLSAQLRRFCLWVLAERGDVSGNVSVVVLGCGDFVAVVAGRAIVGEDYF